MKADNSEEVGAYSGKIGGRGDLRRICCAPGWKTSRGSPWTRKILRGRHTIRLLPTWPRSADQGGHR